MCRSQNGGKAFDLLVSDDENSTILISNFHRLYEEKFKKTGDLIQYLQRHDWSNISSDSKTNLKKKKSLAICHQDKFK
ncbi:hypothetical protein X798_03201, partial [Onchocerca flexuosa]